jgi:hypothetical protein
MHGVVIDFETNGFAGSSVLSVAAIRIDVDWDSGGVEQGDTLVRHYHPVERWNRHAQAVNGLSPARIDELRGEASYPRHFRDDPAFGRFAGAAAFAVAHNAAFDSRFAGLSIPWVCTMRLCGGKLAEAAAARRIAVDRDRLHQALYDTEVCLALFSHLLRDRGDRCRARDVAHGARHPG